MTKPSSLVGTASEVARLKATDVLIGSRDPDGGTPSDMVVRGADIANAYNGGIHPALMNHSGNYLAALIDGNTKGTGSAENLVNLFSYSAYSAFWLPFDVTIDAFAMDLYTAVGSANRKAAIYTVGPTGAPETAIASAILPCDSTGWIETILSADLELEAGRAYYVAWSATANGTAARGALVAGTRAMIKNGPTTSHNDWAKQVAYASGINPYATFPEASPDLSGATFSDIVAATLFLRVK